MPKRYLPPLLTLLLLLVTALPALAAPAPLPFADLPETHWAHSAVSQLLAAGVVAPNPQGAFRPEQPVRRAELVKMLLLARGVDPGTQCQGLFKDAPCSAWYTPVMETGYRLGVVDGTGTGLVNPEDSVTREQLFTLVVRALGRRWEAESLSWSEQHEPLARFSDQGSVDGWARPALALAVKAKITAGYEDGTLRPQAMASRAEAAAVVARVLLPKDGISTTKADGRTVTFARALTMSASEYSPGEAGVGAYTYTGMLVHVGIAAVDPQVVPLGKLLYVEGYGYAVAADIGGAIKGNRIDLYTPNASEALQFGLQPRTVWVLP